MNGVTENRYSTRNGAISPLTPVKLDVFRVWRHMEVGGRRYRGPSL